MFGKLPFGESTGMNMYEGINMYERIVSTYQPPLYNLIMYFWLKINNTEVWFRFFGVAMGFLGMIGIYQSVKKMCNPVTAALAVFFSSTVYHLCYFWQECAEYCLMLATLCWTIYFWICLFQKVTTKNIILFTISSIFPVYSQYGAIFPVFAMLITALIMVLDLKNKKNIFTICLSYFCAFVFAAVPLFCFFFRIQVLHLQRENFFLKNINLFRWLIDYWESLKINLKWCVFSFYSDQVVKIFLVLAFVFVTFAFLMGKNRLLKWMIVFNVITYVIYFIAVKLELYSYGNFGSRYSLFFVPCWIIFGFGIGYRCYCFLDQTGERTIWHYNLPDMAFSFMGICLSFILCYGIYNWSSGIQENWVKEDIRGAVNAWYESNAYEKNTIVYYAADPGFAYYMQENESYEKEMEDSVYYMKWFRDKSIEEYTAYINEIYGEELWPEEIYIIGSHMKPDMDTLIECFIQKGYEAKGIFDKNGAKLIYLYESFTD